MRLKRARKSNHPWAMREQIQKSENSATHNDVPPRRGSLVAPRGATMVYKDDPWGTLISPQFLLFWASARPAGWSFSKRDGRLWRMDRGEWDGPDRVESERERESERGTRLRGVSSASISGLPGAAFPFLLVYLLSTKHRSFFVSVSAVALTIPEVMPQETHLPVVAR